MRTLHPHLLLPLEARARIQLFGLTPNQLCFYDAPHQLPPAGSVLHLVCVSIELVPVHFFFPDLRPHLFAPLSDVREVGVTHDVLLDLQNGTFLHPLQLLSGLNLLPRDLGLLHL